MPFVPGEIGKISKLKIPSFTTHPHADYGSGDIF